MRTRLAPSTHALLACAVTFAAGGRARAEDVWGSPSSDDEAAESRPIGGDNDDGGRRSDDEASTQTEDVVSALRSVVASGATAQPTAHRIVWREDWPRYSFDEAVLSLGLGALLVAAELLPTATAAANWRGGILFDQAVRDELRLRSHDARQSARTASEVLQWVLVGFPFLVDGLVVTAFGDSHWDAAFQIGLISLEAYVLALVVWKMTVLFARRERPVAGACAEGLDSPHCREQFETTSFFSNQAMNAFTGASLVCLHHTHMPLFGDEAADVSTCVAAISAASVVGLLRVMSDFEYLTDVLMGAIVGFVSGYLVPWVLHYQGGARPELRAPVAMLPLPLAGLRDTYGLSVAGWF
jgi:membrane-associated phospholipid phosphatase